MAWAMTRGDGSHRVVIFAGLAGPLGVAALWVFGWSGVIAVPSVPASWHAAFLLLVAAPVLEELAFRGALQDICRSTISALRLQDPAPLTRSNLITSIVFAACHLPHQNAMFAACLLLPSLLLGRVREVTGSILPCMLLHAWFNACFMMVFIRWPA